MIGTAASGLAIGQTDADHAGARISPHQVPTALRAFWADGLFASAQDAFILAYLPLLAASLGANGTQIGLLSGAQSLGSILALYPGAIASRRASSRRWVVVLYAGVLGRLMLFLSAFVVAFMSGNAALYSLTALLTLRAFLGNFVVPAWTSLAGDIIPQALRPRYFASRNFAANLALLTVTPLGGLLLDHVGFPGGYVIALLVSFVLGMCATLAYSRIPEPATRAQPAHRAGGLRASVLRDRRFLSFVGATFSLQFATMLAGPFFNVYLVHNLGGSNLLVGLVSTASAFAGIAGQLYFGDLMARRGSLWVSRLAVLLMPSLPLIWVFVGGAWWALVPNIVGGFLWAAFTLGNFQVLLDVTSEEEREDFVAAFHICMFAAFFTAPFVGGFVVDHWGYHVDFAVSALGRLIAAALFLFVVSTPRERTLSARRAIGRVTAALP